MGNDYVGKENHICSLSSFCMYGRDEANKKKDGIYAGPADSGKLQKVTNPMEIGIINSIIREKRKIQC